MQAIFLITSLFLIFYINVCHHLLNRKAIANFVIGQILRLVVSNHVKKLEGFLNMLRKKET